MEKLILVAFYIIIIFGVYRAVVDQNPVFSVLYLVLTFIGICGMLMFLSVDYLAILFVLIYGGAISILIMFVVMMLDLKELELQNEPTQKFLKFSTLFFCLFCIGFFAFTKTDDFKWTRAVKHTN